MVIGHDNLDDEPDAEEEYDEKLPRCGDGERESAFVWDGDRMAVCMKETNERWRRCVGFAVLTAQSEMSGKV